MSHTDFYISELVFYPSIHFAYIVFCSNKASNVAELPCLYAEAVVLYANLKKEKRMRIGTLAEESRNKT